MAQREPLEVIGSEISRAKRRLEQIRIIQAELKIEHEMLTERIDILADIRDAIEARIP